MLPKSPFLLLVLATGNLSAQTRIPEHAGHPRVSPDGRTIAFSSDRADAPGLYLMNSDGSSARRISPGVDGVRWHPDGRLIAYSRAHDTTVIASLSLENGAMTEIARNVALGETVLAPDGKQLVYGVGDWRVMQLEISRLDGSARRRLTSDPAAHWCADISSDGQRVAVGRRDSTGWSIQVMNADGSGSRVLTPFPRGGGSSECPRWSPDGQRIAFQHGGRFPADTSKSSSEIWVVDAKTGAAHSVAPHAEPWLDEVPSWFPDGKRIAFQSNRTGAWEIWVMHVDGSGQILLTR